MDPQQSPCPPGAHPHLITRPVSLFGAYAIANSPAPGLIVAADPLTATRVADLLERHGLVDVPDTVAALTAWPPPTGPRFLMPRPDRPARPAGLQP